MAEFAVDAGDRVPFTLDWHPSHRPAPEPVLAFHALEQTDAFWREWSEVSTYDGAWPEAVGVSLRVLKALTYAPTGGIVAAATTSLPEALGGVRNWDYRYCWIRDATLTLFALAQCGYAEEALAFRDWLLRAVGRCSRPAPDHVRGGGRAAAARAGARVAAGLRGRRHRCAPATPPSTSSSSTSTARCSTSPGSASRRGDRSSPSPGSGRSR